MAHKRRPPFQHGWPIGALHKRAALDVLGEQSLIWERDNGSMLRCAFAGWAYTSILFSAHSLPLLGRGYD